jgi:hypothetical protein
MAQGQTNKEALFNEVKGSLFEYLMGRKLAQLSGEELKFVESLDKNYLNVLSQQDRMVRQFYPEMLSFLGKVSEASATELIRYLGETPHSPQLIGKFAEINEADLMLASSKGRIPLSLKLNKKNAFVNTKSGGIKSFFEIYFPFIASSAQQSFNALVDQEFTRMSYELHALNDIDYNGDYSRWVKLGKSELPGELNEAERKILKGFYARIAIEIHNILTAAQKADAKSFAQSLPALMGFSSPEILQLVYFHDFKSGSGEGGWAAIHSYHDVEKWLSEASLTPFNYTSSVEVQMGEWTLQIRVKPMNKFTTTAIKINCSVKFKQSVLTSEL